MLRAFGFSGRTALTNLDATLLRLHARLVGIEMPQEFVALARLGGDDVDYFPFPLLGRPASGSKTAV